MLRGYQLPPASYRIAPMASLIEAIEIKRKMYFEYEGAPYHALDVEISRPTARGGQTLVRIKMRNLVTRAVFDKTFKAGEKFEEPDLVVVDAAYLYTDSSGLNFMDQENFETLTLRPELLGRRPLPARRQPDRAGAEVQRQSHRRPVSASCRDDGDPDRNRRPGQHGERQRHEERDPRERTADPSAPLHQRRGKSEGPHRDPRVCGAVDSTPDARPQNTTSLPFGLERQPEPLHSRRWIGWLVLAALVVAGAFAGWWWMSRERPIEVEVATVTARQAGTQASVLNATGYVTARRRATVSSKITGKVVQVNIEEGMAVRAGQVLARLDDETQRAAVALAEAQAEAARRNVNESEVRLAEARVTLERAQKLVKVGYSTTAEVDAAQAAVDSLDARIRAAREQVKVAERQVALERTNLDSTIIRAPFDGVAISKDAQPGEMVSPVSAGGGFTRTGIGTIVDMASLEIEVDVNESYINRVKPDQGVTAVLDAYPDLQIPGRVITMVPTADRQKATVLVRIGFDKLDPRILPDMGVKVTFLRDKGSSRMARQKGCRPCAPWRSFQRRPSGQTASSPTPSSSVTGASIGARSRQAAPTATVSRLLPD